MKVDNTSMPRLAFKLILSAVASGLLLRLALPPSDLGLLIFLALAPALSALSGYSNTWWFSVGCIVGLLASGHIFFSAISWGWNLAVLPPLLIIVRLGLCFYLVGWLTNKYGVWWMPLALPLSWFTLACLFDEPLGLPVILSIALAIDFPALITPASWLGALGLDLVILFLNGALALSLRRSVTRFVIMMGISLSVLYFTANAPEGRPQPGQSQVIVAIVQPGLSPQELKVSEESLFHRGERERLMDELTRAAILQNPDLVVWPEGGNGLLNVRLPRRVKALQDMSKASDAYLFIAGPDLSPDGRQRNSMHLVHKGSFLGGAHKNMLVPLAEDHLVRGEPQVFETRFGRIGVAICYDILFLSHMRSLKDKGAEIVLVSSNDASLEKTSLPLWHVAFAILRGVEQGMATIFVSNNGPSLWADNHGRVAEARWINENADIFLMSIDLPNEPKNPSLTHVMSSLIYILLAIFVAWELVWVRKSV